MYLGCCVLSLFYSCVTALYLCKFLTLILLNGFLPCFGFFFLREFYNVINGNLARNSLTHLYIVLIIVSLITTLDKREGELIFRYIYHHLNCHKPFDRLWISSLTDKAIREGLAHLKTGSAYDNLYHSAKARSEADWLVGINASRALSIARKGGYSLGRVQTPTLAMVCRRYMRRDTAPRMLLRI